MVVSLIASESVDGSAVNDLLAGGGSNFGVDMGQVANNSYSPLIDKSNNTGAKSVFIRHDAVTDPISALAIYMQEFGVGSGYPYGGGASAASDFTTMKALGAASGVSKNNADGNSGGLWMEMEADVSTTNQFDAGGRSTFVKIFGKASQGQDLASAIPLLKEGMVYDSGGQTNATNPVDGYLGKTGDTVLGDNCLTKFRSQIPNSFLQANIIQWELVWTYAFTG